MTPTTPQHIISTVVYTLCILLAAYMLTLSVGFLWQVITTGVVDEKLLMHLQSVGQTLMGAVAGMLINTRSQTTPVAESSRVVTTTSTETPPNSPENAT